MLLVHQTGSVQIGEVIRYTLTYTPKKDRVVPAPTRLYVRVRNSSAVPLRAAYLHGPYTLYAACYPHTFNPNAPTEPTDGVPQFEPNLKAGGSWLGHLVVPLQVIDEERSFTWIIEVASQVVFSTSATVNFELFVGRDEKSLELAFASLASHAPATPGHLHDQQQSRKAKNGRAAQSKGIYSHAIDLVVDDTVSLWNKPAFPQSTTCAKKKVHLVVLTHGLHSNLGSDMLYLKESIDAAAKEAKMNDDEEIIVRGFGGNSCRTERGIQYLGKRLAKWILTMTYPDQPYVPAKKSVKKKISDAFTSDDRSQDPHQHSSIHKDDNPKDRAYQISSISFVAHSLGGLTQTYAIAYIHKHSPEFFRKIKPINYVAMAAPFLGLSNENPLYVKFALDFGLVGRTGQDLGLAWKSTTMLKGGWDAMIGGIGKDGQRAHKPDPGSKPLLRILPTGHTHEVLKLFRNRTVYSNVVNDGIVPLRTSCLLFLDWTGLGRVQKARRENGLVAGLAGWGWAELTGTNASAKLKSGDLAAPEADYVDPKAIVDKSSDNVPQPEQGTVREDNAGNERQDSMVECTDAACDQTSKNAFSSVFSFFRSPEPKPHYHAKKSKIYSRSQTHKSNESLSDASEVQAPPKTSILESAGDVLNPPLPDLTFITKPSSRPRTIFHDRVYHPEDIPPAPLAKRPSRLVRSFSAGSTNTLYGDDRSLSTDASGMKVEEKIARAYHHELSWRKVLVRLEPDAHNNMVVRRMFSNAYGWPVIKHLVDTHFASTFEAKTSDEQESNRERARPVDQRVDDQGSEVKTTPIKQRTRSEAGELDDTLPDLRTTQPSISQLGSWDEILRDGSDDEDEDVESSQIRREAHDNAFDQDEIIAQPPKAVVKNQGELKAAVDEPMSHA